MNAAKVPRLVGWTLYVVAFPFLVMIVGIGGGFAVGAMLLAIPIAVVTMPGWLPAYIYIKEIWGRRDQPLQMNVDDERIIDHLVEAYRARLLRLSKTRPEVVLQALEQDRAGPPAAVTNILATGVFVCSLCGGAAGVAQIVRRPMGKRLERWSTSFPVEDDVLGAAIQTLRRGDACGLHALNQHFAPFYCPTCNATFCKRHWLIWHDFDDNLRDCVRGTCPNGHTGILED